MTILFGDKEIGQSVVRELPLSPLQVQITRKHHSGTVIATGEKFSFEHFEAKIWFNEIDVNKFNNVDPCATGARATAQTRRGNSNIVQEMKIAFPGATIRPVANGRYTISWKL